MSTLTIRLPATKHQRLKYLGYRPERRKAQAVVRTETCSEKSLPNCRSVIDPVAFFETESLS